MSKTASQRDAAPMGKPSGDARGGDGLRDVSAGTRANKERSAAAKYTTRNDEPAETAKVLHKNRNVNKGEHDGE